ncbi:hypothetical protein JOF36_002465 [Pseudonocardia parietis]|uniref:Uncharacterized protein n=1 Tax=Pseudonocardia parietis TaxID=570936 RepID=A0ABS4VS86_9PSEU|nr:hypothetical protein [Pseudonocardia parietis]
MQLIDQGGLVGRVGVAQYGAGLGPNGGRRAAAGCVPTKDRSRPRRASTPVISMPRAR